MRSIVAQNAAPAWSSALHATGELTVIVAPEGSEFREGEESVWDRKTGALWLSASLLGDDAAIDHHVRQAVASIGTYHRPALTAVAGGGDTTPAARPALSLVRD
ncbi:hypothetical protein ACQPW3_10745 [Actinosynnema sp. CA-248983]